MLIAICDDEYLELETIEKMICQVAEELSAEIETAVYPSGEALLQAIEAGAQPALAVLDVYMKGWNGIEAARRLRERLPGLPVAFLTTSREHAVDAFELEAIHYLLKPVTLEAVQVLLARFLARGRRTSPPALVLTCGREKHSLLFSQIACIVSCDRGTSLYLEDQSRRQWLSCPFRRVTEQLDREPDFLRLSRSCMVNLNAVLYIGRENCHMKDGTLLPVSRRERQEVQKRYNDFLFRKMSRAKEGAP